MSSDQNRQPVAREQENKLPINQNTRDTWKVYAQGVISLCILFYIYLITGTLTLPIWKKVIEIDTFNPSNQNLYDLLTQPALLITAITVPVTSTVILFSVLLISFRQGKPKVDGNISAGLQLGSKNADPE